jgi:hypothetical protein
LVAIAAIAARTSLAAPTSEGAVRLAGPLPVPPMSLDDLVRVGPSGPPLARSPK